MYTREVNDMKNGDFSLFLACNGDPFNMAHYV